MHLCPSARRPTTLNSRPRPRYVFPVAAPAVTERKLDSPPEQALQQNFPAGAARQSLVRREQRGSRLAIADIPGERAPSRGQAPAHVVARIQQRTLEFVGLHGIGPIEPALDDVRECIVRLTR